MIETNEPAVQKTHRIDAEMTRVVLFLQAESVESSLKLMKNVKNELSDLGSVQHLAMDPRVKALDGQNLGVDKKAGPVVDPILRLHVARNCKVTRANDVSE